MNCPRTHRCEVQFRFQICLAIHLLIFHYCKNVSNILHTGHQRVYKDDSKMNLATVYLFLSPNRSYKMRMGPCYQDRIRYWLWGGLCAGNFRGIKGLISPMPWCSLNLSFVVLKNRNLHSRWDPKVYVLLSSVISHDKDSTSSLVSIPVAVSRENPWDPGLWPLRKHTAFDSVHSPPNAVPSFQLLPSLLVFPSLPHSSSLFLVLPLSLLWLQPLHIPFPVLPWRDLKDLFPQQRRCL